MTSKPTSILMFFPWIGNHPQDAFAGVQGAAAARHWEFFSADTARAEDGSMQLHRSSRVARSVSELVRLLRPDGIVVWQDALSRAELRAAAGKGVPTVFVDCGAMDEAGKADRAGRVRGDPKSIATLAARVLLASRYDTFAFVPNPVPLPWSTERGEACIGGFTLEAWLTPCSYDYARILSASTYPSPESRRLTSSPSPVVYRTVRPSLSVRFGSSMVRA